jgi:bla regulator protein BlaR1
MILSHLFSWTSQLGGILFRASVGGGLCALLVWAVCKTFPRLPAYVRCLLWWGVCLRFLVGLTGWVPLGLPILPTLAREAPVKFLILDQRQAPRRAAVREQTAGGRQQDPMAELPILRFRSAVAGSSAPGISRWSGTTLRAAWPSVLALLTALYLGGLAVQIARVATQWKAIRRFLAQSFELTDPEVLEAVWEQASAIDLQPPAVLVSPSVTSPQTVGIRRPAIILPANPVPFSRLELSMAIGHELAHIRRRDLLWGWIATSASRLFFFHPAAVLAAREYGLAREAACDAEVLGRLSLSPRAYGSFLLKLTATSSPCGMAALSAAPIAETLKRRLAMLHTSSQAASGKRRLAPVLAVAALLPIDFVARPLAPIVDVAAAPSRAEQRASEGLSAPTVASQKSVSTPAPAAPRTVAKKPVLGPKRLMAVAAGIDTAGEPVVFIHQGQTMVNGSGGVDIEDVKAANAFSRTSGGGDLLWFRFHGKDYYTHDVTAIQSVAEIYAPMEELGRQQGEAGRRQGALGKEQGQLGSRQGDLDAQQGELERRLGELEARIGRREAELSVQNANGGSSGKDEHLEKLRDEAKKRRQEIRERASLQRDRSSLLVEQQQVLGEQQKVLGELQRELGRQQREANETAEKKVHVLIAKIVASGVAQPMP